MTREATNRLSAARIRELARTGAEEALKRLRAEVIAIERTFPELALARKRRAVRRSLAEATDRTRRVSAAARKAISARMKRYWAERRKARAKVRWAPPSDREAGCVAGQRTPPLNARSAGNRAKTGEIGED